MIRLARRLWRWFWHPARPAPPPDPYAEAWEHLVRTGSRRP